MANKATSEHVILWQIEHFGGNIVDEHHCLYTPIVAAESLNWTQWRLVFFPLTDADSNYAAFFLYRNGMDSGPKELLLNVEFCVVDRNGCEQYNQQLLPQVFVRNAKFGLKEFLHRDALTRRRQDLLPNNVLTLKCRVWKSRQRPFLTSLSYNHTKISTEKSSIVWAMRDSRNNKPRKRFFRIDSNAAKNCFELQCTSVTNEENKTIVSIVVLTKNPPEARVRLSAKVIAQSSEGNPLDQVESSRFFEAQTENEWHFPDLKFTNVARRPEDDNTVKLSYELTITRASQITQEEGIVDDGLQSDEVTLRYHLKSVYETTAKIVSMNDRHSNADILMRTSDTNKTFWAHKMILNARSPVFREILNDFDFKKKRWLQHTLGNVAIGQCNTTVTKGRITVRFFQGLDIAEISDITPETLSQVLECMYTDAVNPNNVDNAILLYKAGFYLEFRVLRRKSRDYLKSMISLCTLKPLLTFADCFECKELWCYYMNFINENLYLIISSEEWDTFSKENNAVARKILDCLQSNFN